MRGDNQVIRFSAALVAVAIGVLIGGIATSKLVLVYIAIVVSAAALISLAIGVVLKRDELFGDAQGLVPAGAGGGAVSAPRGTDSRDRGENRDRAARPSPAGGAAFSGAAPSEPVSSPAQ